MWLLGCSRWLPWFCCVLAVGCNCCNCNCWLPGRCNIVARVSQVVARMLLCGCHGFYVYVLAMVMWVVFMTLQCSWCGILGGGQGIYDGLLGCCRQFLGHCYAVSRVFWVVARVFTRALQVVAWAFLCDFIDFCRVSVLLYPCKKSNCWEKQRCMVSLFKTDGFEFVKILTNSA